MLKDQTLFKSILFFLQARVRRRFNSFPQSLPISLESRQLLSSAGAWYSNAPEKVSFDTAGGVTPPGTGTPANYPKNSLYINDVKVLSVNSTWNITGFLSLDFDGDGDQDFAIRRDTERWYRITRTGAASVSFSSTGYAMGGTNYSDFVVGDFITSSGSAGLEDIAGRDTNGKWRILYSTGTTFVPLASTAVFERIGAGAPVSWKDIQVGDFDNDGDDDIVGLRNAPTIGSFNAPQTLSNAAIYVAISSGANMTRLGGFKPVAKIPDAAPGMYIDGGITRALVGDFNGDLQADIVAWNESKPNLSSTNKLWVGLSTTSGGQFNNFDWGTLDPLTGHKEWATINVQSVFFPRIGEFADGTTGSDVGDDFIYFENPLPGNSVPTTTQTYQIKILKSNGLNAFNDPNQTGVPGTSSAFGSITSNTEGGLAGLPEVVMTGDWNSDGWDDLMITNKYMYPGDSAESNNYLWTNTGSGFSTYVLFGNHSLYSLTGRPFFLVTRRYGIEGNGSLANGR